jgi:hypothetical protein
MRRCTHALVLLAVSLLVAGCAAGPHGEPAPVAPSTPTPPTATSQSTADESPALGLVGLWRVSGARGEADPTWLRLDAEQFQLWRECGMITGSWRAGEAAFLASVDGASGSCADSRGLPAVPWLDAAMAYERSGERWQLIDRDGALVAVLAIDGAPDPIPTAARFYAEPPEIDDRVREAFRQVPALPASLDPASAASLVGRWVPVGRGLASDPHAEFSPSGSWNGSDGCNGGAGRWTVTDDGEFLATSGASTMMWCVGAMVPYWVQSARLAGFDGAELVLLDADGAELGRLQRG